MELVVNTFLEKNENKELINIFRIQLLKVDFRKMQLPPKNFMAKKHEKSP